MMCEEGKTYRGNRSLYIHNSIPPNIRLTNTYHKIRIEGSTSSTFQHKTRVQNAGVRFPINDYGRQGGICLLSGYRPAVG